MNKIKLSLTTQLPVVLTWTEIVAVVRPVRLPAGIVVVLVVVGGNGVVLTDQI